MVWYSARGGGRGGRRGGEVGDAHIAMTKVMAVEGTLPGRGGCLSGFLGQLGTSANGDVS